MESTAPATMARVDPARQVGRFPVSSTDAVAVAAAAAVAVLARLPFLRQPLGSDEGGLLLIGAQWHPGTSVYGDYFVDRPPLLIDIFALAHAAGGLAALRVLGILLVVVSVVLAARVGRLAGGSPAVTASTAAIFLSTPLFGVHEVNGELLATPALLGVLCCALEAARRGATSPKLLAGAGALAATAALIKQNEIDGFIVLGVGALTFLTSSRQPRGVLAVARWITAGASLVAVAAVLQAAALGTSPLALWDAVVTFRLDAAQVIDASAAPSVHARLHALLGAAALSGAPLVVLRLRHHLRRAPGLQDGSPDLRWAAIAVLAWETFSVIGGGSYWLHYLICLVPGLVLTSAITSRGHRRGTHDPVLTYAAVATLVAMVAFLLQPSFGRPDPVITWLRRHDSPGQTAIVAYGHPDYLTASGLTSPYEQLWSLPVRVRDPDLSQLRAVLSGPDRPDWIITGATGSLGGWGIDPTAVQPVFDAEYRLVADLGSRRIYRDRDDPAPSTTATHPQEIS